LGFWESKVHKNGYPLPKTLTNCRAKFDAAGFILNEEIRNRKKDVKTHKDTNKQ